MFDREALIAAVTASLERSGEQIVDRMREVAPQDSGDLVAGISSAIDSDQLTLTIRSDAPHSRYVEDGTANTPAQPFFYPTIREFEDRVYDDLAKAAKEALDQ
ncbi:MULTISPECIES: HK97-gp10 family putative phage morphogenesis protein [unclassified Beijerinckia]|uniref:HK97-gp10 family putative phage morphogenesis protein n=1 Tax=unclassified Beijerinckia TaxID=2638183 RepID=UPI000896E815|nr:MULTISPECIES: HK97-gp10 family putative phage morphogenesis protein [unclassified Beijerinckia]MDH7795798.1 HK97 gp10 family phage protein [Beijerinckia sp. GAS462]SEC16843.1 phage protein, HK97 gp10 family [Beijerinckia sp. 28-YEA-48]